MRYKSFRSIAAATACSMALGFTACTKHSVATDYRLIQPSTDWSAIFSTRPTEDSHAFFLVKLKSAPLFTALSSQAGKPQTDANLLKAVMAEQDALIKALGELSSEIKVIYRYRMLINGVAIVAPTALAEKIGLLAGVSHLESAGHFARPELPKTEAETQALTKTLAQRNSVKFIGAAEAHGQGIRGQGLKVGIIDSGIDYTHAMLGGEGTEAAFKAVDVDQPSKAFPNNKVVGGVDFVGSKYNSGAIEFVNRVPTMDTNPMDEGGHGTHVAGTVGGVGDGVDTYDGVAPDAALHALKVFGADGSTNDTVVIAALEYAADPNGDGDLSDRLDVVNLSLGSGYGSAQVLYGEAVRNLTAGGVMVVAAAGNSGNVPYIVGSPGVTSEAFSVAAGTDDMDHNWKFRAVKFQTASNPELFVEAIEGAVTKPLAESGSVKAALVYGGLADKDFSEELKASLVGKIAFLDRGAVAFTEKIKRATDAGAIGVVMANNQDGEPIVMGGDGGPFPIPGVMITKQLADQLKAEMKLGDVVAELTSPHMIEKPELIDTITSFSSRGPRSVDGSLKPEITAPGEKIVSARLGGGKVGTRMSGTSMASPHMAGVMTLLKQKFPSLSPLELKAVAMGTAKTVVDLEGNREPISRQGAGRVQVIKALNAKAFALPSAVSLGEVAVESVKTMSRKIDLKSVSTTDEDYVIELREASPELSIVGSPGKVSLKAGESQTLDIRFTVNASTLKETVSEVSGLVVLKKAGNNSASDDEVLRIPVLAVVNRIANLQASSLMVRSTSKADSQGAVVDLTLKNASKNPGEALIFNKIGQDPRKEDPTLDPFRSRICDLAESGYRVIEKGGAPVLQIAVKLHEPMTTWDLCEVSVLIDRDGDHEADQELAGLRMKYVSGLSGEDYASVLLDVKAARAIRAKYEADMLKPKPKPEPGTTPEPAPTLSYAPAIVALENMRAIENSTLAVLETPVSSLNLTSQGTLAVRIATSAQTGSAIEPDDFLANNPKRWRQLNLRAQGAAFVELPESVSVGAQETKTVSFTKGAGNESLLILMPNGRPLWNGLGRDGQSQTVTPKYKVD
jgi:minor extracellular serine protease Vpr